MCGIVGIIQKNKSVDEDLLKKMTDKISHRGLDDDGVWVSKNKHVGFGHRRLSIVDLSSAGHQPMPSVDDNFTIIFNGEIYNFQDIKKELLEKGYRFKTKTDTEVLLCSYIEWGEKCLEKLNGMFAFAIWDEKKERLFAARDRLGEKPFKYYFDDEKFIFASEIKSILEYPSIEKKVDWQAIDSAMSFRFVPAPMTGFKNIFKLPAGHYLIWENDEIEIKKYWNISSVEEDRNKTFEQYKKETWNLFLDSVKKRMMSDVPLGAFLSGGLDSSSVVAAMAEVNDKPINTFVISLDGKSEDSKHAKIVADYFKTNHHEIHIEDIDYKKLLHDLVEYYDEPFFDASALPSLIINQKMKKHVTVALSGDGGDELFGGYDSYTFAKFLKQYNYIPQSLRKIVANVFSFSKDKQYKAEILAKDFYIAYSDYYSVWQSALPISKKYITKDELYLPKFKKEIDESFSAALMKKWFSGQGDMQNRAMLADIQGRLADGYMTKVDIASMASALEVRPPFLDYRLVELSRKIPSKFKIKGNNEKYIWKEVIKNKLPKEILTRKKIGFSLPLDVIMRKHFDEIIEETILSQDSMVSEVFSFGAMRTMWNEHLQKKADYSNHLWSILILELWLKKYTK